MSDYQDGYNAGYEDGLNNEWSSADRMQTFLGQVIDFALGVTEREEEWRDGYKAGYADGKEEYEQNR